MFPPMHHLMLPRSQPMSLHRDQQFGPRRACFIGMGQSIAEGSRCWQIASVFHDETPHGSAITIPPQAACKEREMQIASRLLPCAESAISHILLHTFTRAPEPGELP